MNRHVLLSISGFLIFLVAASPLIAAEISLDYLEGDLEYRTGRDTWISVEIGETFPEGSTVRLSDRGYADMTLGPRTVTLTNDGLYETSDLFGDEPEKATFRQVIGSTFSALLGRGKSETRATAAAVRASEAVSDDFITWDDETDYLTEGMNLYAAGDLEAAREMFEDGSFNETGAIQRECDFRLGLTLQALGEQRDARTALTRIRVSMDDPFIDEYVVVVGTLYLESLDYAEADRLLEDYLSSNPTGNAAQAAWLLSAYSLQGQGRNAESRSAAREAMNLGADTDIGRAAADMAG